MCASNALKRFIPPIAGIAMFGFFAFSYAAGFHAFYRFCMWHLGIDVFRFPFLDSDTVLSALRCMRKGVDVFVVNPCDPLNRVFDYSPLWLLGAIFPVTTGWIVPTGLCLACFYLVILAMLPPGRKWFDVILITLCVVSPDAILAVERGNNDIIILSLATVCSLLLLCNGRVRFWGYAFAFLAGLLKYYPMTLMVLAIREKISILIGIFLSSVFGVSLFLYFMGSDLIRALKLVPKGNHFDEWFGAETLPWGLRDIGAYPWFASGIFAFFMLGSLAGILVLGTSRPMAMSIARLTPRERVFLTASALLIGACFFTAQNIPYRGIMLLPAIPGLTALRRIAPTKAYRNLFAITIASVLFVLWSMTLGVVRSAVFDGWDEKTRTIFLTFWLLRELFWWTVVTVLLSCWLADALSYPLPEAVKSFCLKRYDSLNGAEHAERQAHRRRHARL